MPNVSVRILVIVLVGGVLVVMHTPAGKDSEKATAPPYDHALGKQSASAEDPPAATGASGDSMVWGAVAVASVCSLMYLTAVVVYFAKGEVDWSGVPYGIVLFASRNCVCVLVYYICCGIALMVGLSHADISAIHAPRGQRSWTREFYNKRRSHDTIHATGEARATASSETVDQLIRAHTASERSRS